MSTPGVVLGASGFLGSRIVEHYPDDLIAGPRLNIHRATDLGVLEGTLNSFLDDVPTHAIVNCIGLREGTDEQLTLANQVIPRVVVDVAAKRSVRVIHIGSAAELVSAREGVNPDVARPLLRYSESKKAGTREVLQYDRATVARIHNLHGIPHQSSSGLHSLCLAIKRLSERPELLNSPVIDVTRDYIHWQVALAELRAIVDKNMKGIIEIRSGISLPLHAIVDELPLNLRNQLLPKLVPPDILTNVPDGDESAPTLGSITAKAAEIADEVLECASF